MALLDATDGTGVGMGLLTTGTGAGVEDGDAGEAALVLLVGPGSFAVHEVSTARQMRGTAQFTAATPAVTRGLAQDLNRYAANAGCPPVDKTFAR